MEGRLSREALSEIVSMKDPRVEALFLSDEDFKALENPVYEVNGKDEGNEKLREAYLNLIDFIKEYMDMDEDSCKITSIWCMGTYFHEQFETYPYLFYNAMRGSGKTRMLKIIANVANLGDGTIQNDMKEAVLFRMIRNKILCIDEFENVGAKDKQTLRQILNSAYKKGMKIVRMKKVKKFDGESFETEEFEPYMPIAMANIWGMDEVLGDRAITLILEKSSNPAVTKKIEDFKNNPKILKVRTILEQCSLVQCCFSKSYIKDWNNYIDSKYSINYITTHTHNYTKQHNKEEVFFSKIDDAGIDGRNFELILPLLIVAKMIGEDIFEDILRVSKEVVSNKKEGEFENSKDVALYDFISTKEDMNLEFTAVKDITSGFRDFVDEPKDKDSYLNEKWMGRALKRLGLVIKSKRTHKGMSVILNTVKAKNKIRMFK